MLQYWLLPRYGQWSDMVGNTPRKNNWNDQQTIELLANLDRLVDTLPSDDAGPTPDVLPKLKPLLNKQRTQSEIRGKLYFEWRKNASKRMSNQFKDVYRKGTRCMDRLPERMRCEIQVLGEVIKRQEFLNYLGSPRILRSSSRNLAEETSRSKRGQTLPSDSTPTKRTRTKRRFDLRDRTVDSANTEPLPKKICLEVDPRSVSSSPPSSPPSTPSNVTFEHDDDDIDNDDKNGVNSPQSHDTCIEGGAEASAADVGEDSHSATQALLYAGTLQNASKIDYDDPNSIRSFPETPIHSGNHETLQDLLNDNIFFRNKWLEAEKEIKRLKQEARRNFSSQTAGSTASDSKSADRIFQQRSIIARLQNQSFLHPFQELGRHIQPPLNRATIRFSFDKMHKDIRSLPFTNGLVLSNEGRTTLESDDLRSLKRSVFVKEPPDAKPDGPYCQVGLMVQALTGAAICEWVFHGALQSMAMIKTPLLEKYRYYLHIICGETTLRNLDLAAHQALIDEEHFQAIFLQRTAEKLANRLLRALDPLITCGGPQENKRRFEERLKSIFHSALNIKVLGMIGTETFECIWPTLHSAFDSSSMTEAPSDDAIDSEEISEQHEKIVRLPLAPGLLSYDIEREVVDYNSFIPAGEKGLGKSTVVATAIVHTR